MSGKFEFKLVFEFIIFCPTIQYEEIKKSLKIEFHIFQCREKLSVIIKNIIFNFIEINHFIYFTILNKNFIQEKILLSLAFFMSVIILKQECNTQFRHFNTI